MLSTSKASSRSIVQTLYPWSMCLIAMIFYCYNYFLRVSPSVMQNELSEAFHITAYQFGTLAAFYYYAYTPMQLPAGMLYDKFGVRFVLSFACLVAVSGLAVFISADSYDIAKYGRFLIGLGCAFAYIGTLKLASNWLPANRFATIAGLTTTIGMIAAAGSQKYLSNFIELVGYKEALHSALIVGMVLSVLMVLLVRNHPEPHHAHFNSSQELKEPINFKQLLSSIIIIFSNKQMWLIGAIGCLLYLPASVFLDLWGIPYLRTVYGLTASQAVGISNITFLGWIISNPIIGIVSDKIRRRKLPLIVMGLFASFLFILIFYGPKMNASALYTIFFFVGVSLGAQPLCFALGKENNALHLSGTSVATTNMLVMLGGVICQPLVGKLLDLHSTATNALGLPIYNASDFAFAMSLVPIGVVLSVVLCFFLKETHCQQQK